MDSLLSYVLSSRIPMVPTYEVFKVCVFIHRSELSHLLRPELSKFFIVEWKLFIGGAYSLGRRIL